MIRAAILVRLSREDLNQPGTLEEKMARHLSIARDLVERHGLPPVPESDTYTEAGVSGRALGKRPGTLALLDRCRAGYYTHLVTAYQSRLLRGDKRDEADIEDALLDGCVTLITTEAEIRFDEYYESRHAYSFEMRAAADRNYVRDIIKLLKQSNRQRILQGQLSGGQAPMGYFWQPALYDRRQLIEPAHYEIVGDLEITNEGAAMEYAARHLPACMECGKLDAEAYLRATRRVGQPDGALLPGVACTGGEYATVLEIFRRIEREGYKQIVRDLNARRVPKGSQSRFRPDFAGVLWYTSTVQRMLRNPHYAGFPVHKRTTDRKGRIVKLTEDQHVYARDEQPWPHPIRRPDQEVLLARVAARALPGAARPGSSVLLTGLMVCAHGDPCVATGRRYTCLESWSAGQTHPGDGIGKRHADAVAAYLLHHALLRLPARVPTGRRASDSRTEELLALNKQINAKRRELEDLRRHEGTFSRSGAADAFRSTVEGIETEVHTLQAQYRLLQADTSRETSRESLRVLAELKRQPFEQVWRAADTYERRALLRFVIAEIRIQPEPAPRHCVQRLSITLQPWITPYYNPETIEVFETRAYRNI